MYEENPRLRQAIMQVVDNQLREMDPPETKETFDRLVSEGVAEQEVRRLIRCVVATEIFEVLKRDEPYNHARFVKALHKLPNLPWE